MSAMKDETGAAWKEVGHALEALGLTIKLHYEQRAAETMGDPVVLSERRTATPRELAAIVGDAMARVGDSLNDPAVKEQSTKAAEALEHALNETVRALPATGHHASGREP